MKVNFRNSLIFSVSNCLIIGLSKLLIHSELPRKMNSVIINKLQRPFFNYLIIKALPRKINPLNINTLKGVL